MRLFEVGAVKAADWRELIRNVILNQDASPITFNVRKDQVEYLSEQLVQVYRAVDRLADLIDDFDAISNFTWRFIRLA